MDAQGKPTSDHIATLVDLAQHPEKVPLGTPNIRDIGSVATTGDSSYWRSLYLANRHDSAIHTERELLAKTRQIEDPEFWESSPNISTQTPYGALKAPPPPSFPEEVDLANRFYQRFAFQEVVLACFADQHLDAVVYPTMNIPPEKIQAPEEPSVNGRVQAHWTIFGQQGSPAITVPAGFTRQVYDRVPDPASADGTRLVGPVAAHLPAGVDFAARPFDEPLLLRIAAAYQTIAPHREVAAGFAGPLAR